MRTREPRIQSPPPSWPFSQRPELIQTFCCYRVMFEAAKRDHAGLVLIFARLLSIMPELAETMLSGKASVRPDGTT